MSAENYTEAGFTLKLYADMLSWENDTLTFAPMDDANGQPEWRRKERLYLRVRSLVNINRYKCINSAMKFHRLFNTLTKENAGKKELLYVRNWQISMRQNFMTTIVCLKFLQPKQSSFKIF